MNELNVDKLAKALSDILSRKHDAKITVTFTPKNTAQPQQGR
jgi:hypothetical protein